MIAPLILAGTLATSITVDRGAYVISAESIGTGVPMVAIAGGPGFSGRAVWGVGFGMRNSLKTYLFDQLGTGKSNLKNPKSELKPHLTLANTVDDLEALRKKSGAKKWIVFGQSWGAIVAMVYASKYPNSVKRLVLASIPGIGHDGTILGTNLNRLVPASVANEILDIAADPNLSEDEKLARQVLIGMPYYFFDLDYGKKLASEAPAELFSPAVFRAMSFLILNSGSYESALRKLNGTKFPVSMLQGQQDPCGSAMPFLLKEKYLPQAKISLLNECGHFSWIESREDFFYEFHQHLGLPLPEYLRHIADWEHPSKDKERALMKQRNWPFGPGLR